MNATAESMRVSAPSALWGWGRLQGVGNLLRKELFESRPVLVVGLAIFVAMPAFLEFMYFVLLRPHEWFVGFAWAMVMFVGWLYATILGAHVVCRDWGRTEERFLLAQPVRRGAIVDAKGVAGLLVLLAVMGVAVLWDLAAYQLSDFSRNDNLDELLEPLLVIGAVLLVMYSVSFALAVATRQMLTSVLATILLLLVVATVPLLSHRFDFLWMDMLTSRQELLPVFIAAAVLMVIAVVVAYGTAGRERPIQIRPRVLAWGAGLTVLLLFSTTVGEVGNSLNVRDQHLFVAQVRPGYLHGYTNVGAACTAEDRVVSLSVSYQCKPRKSNHEPEQSVRSLLLRSTALSKVGKVQHAREFALPEPWPDRATVEQSVSLQTVGRDTVIVDVVPFPVGVVYRQRLHWPADASPEVIQVQHVDLPDLYPTWVPPERRKDCVFTAQPISGKRYSYIRAYLSWMNSESASDQWREKRELDPANALYIVDWEAAGGPTVTRLPLPPRSGIMREGDELSVYVHGPTVADSSNAQPVYIGHTVRVKLDEPGNLASLLAEERPWVPVGQPTDDTGRFARTGGGQPILLCEGDLTYIADAYGLQILELTTERRFVQRGECWRSILAMMMIQGGRDHWLKLYGKGLLVEQVETGAVFYDVTRPDRPKQVGFFNYVPRWGTELVSTGDHLVLLEGSLVTVLDRPVGK